MLCDFLIGENIMFNGGKYSSGIDSEYWLFSDEASLSKELGDDAEREMLGSRARRRWEREEGRGTDIH
jgi:hypothetical protein